MNNLARFRADPSKIRMSIRREGARWRATVESRVTGAKLSALGRVPRAAVRVALGQAEAKEIDGIDLWMGWAYEHPWKGLRSLK